MKDALILAQKGSWKPVQQKTQSRTINPKVYVDEKYLIKKRHRQSSCEEVRVLRASRDVSRKRMDQH